MTFAFVEFFQMTLHALEGILYVEFLSFPSERRRTILIALILLLWSVTLEKRGTRDEIADYVS